MHRALPVSFLAAMLALAACTEAPVLAPDAGAAATSHAMSAAASRAASPTRPAGGTCTLAARPVVLAPLPGQPANVTRRQTEWVCQLRHLGRTTATTTEAGAAGPSGSAVTGTTVYTAANGDQLFTTFSGTATFPNSSGILTFSGAEMVTGGTGRYAGASGSFARATRVNVILGTGQYEITGTLSY